MEQEKKKVGRPVGWTKDNKKDECVIFRCTSEEVAKLKENAKKANMSVAKYILSKCL